MQSSANELVLICEKYAAWDSSKTTLFAFQKVRQEGTVSWTISMSSNGDSNGKKKKQLSERKAGLIAFDFIVITCNCNCLVSARNVIFKLIPKRMIY